MAKRVATNRIKKNQAYNIPELADIAMVSQITVRRWIKDGMTIIDNNRPTLVMGFSALAFLDTRQAKAKQPMQTHQFYCLRCRAPKTPLGMMADYIPQSPSGGRLVALCASCECTCNRNISAHQLPQFQAVLDIATRDNEQA